MRAHAPDQRAGELRARPPRRVPTSPGPTGVLALQRQAGNRAVAGLLAPVQRHEVQDCGGTHPAKEVHAAHGRARTMVSIAAMESATTSDPTVRALARKHFKLTVPPAAVKDKKLWFGRVRQVLSALDRDNAQTVYECEPRQSWKDGMCTSGSIAVTIRNIHLCPQWWSLTSLDDRAFVLIHEWAHRWGPMVNQVLETYCDAPDYAGLSADELVAEPDAYASYVFELVTGTAPPTTVC